MVRLIKIEERPEPDLKFMHLFTNAAPCSSKLSPAEPALGYVIMTVELTHESSVATVNPLGKVLTDTDVALAGWGVGVGKLRTKGGKRMSSSFPALCKGTLRNKKAITCDSVGRCYQSSIAIADEAT